MSENTICNLITPDSYNIPVSMCLIKDDAKILTQTFNLNRLKNSFKTGKSI